MYALLTEFFRKSGHCDVPETWLAATDLPRWVNQQRSLKGANRLTSDQEKKLNDLGFSWAIFDAQWEQNFVALKTRLNAIRRGQSATVDPQLARWSQTQRQQNFRGVLPAERKARLDAISFEWNPHAERWDQMLAALRSFHEVHGHCRVPTEWAENRQLARWVGVQRARKSAGSLQPAREHELEALGFSWSVGRSGGKNQCNAWFTMFDRLTAFHSEHGQTRVPQNFTADRKLGWWVTTQRRNRRVGKLSPEQIGALDELGFVWSFAERASSRSSPSINAFQKKWNAMLTELREFREKHDHCRVPYAWSENRQLASWVSVQRQRLKLHKLSPERISALNELGFDWVIPRNNRSTAAVTKDQWSEMLAALVEYKKEYGDCRVPQRWKHNLPLAAWVADQRVAYHSGRLDSAHRHILAEMEFDWDPITTRWETMFSQLLEFKKHFGHTNVPSNSPEYFKLGNWVKMQRRDKKIGRPISRERLTRLDGLGFTWRFVEPTSWEKMLELLANFKKRYGHCNVPQRFPENVRFGRWVNTQRMRLKNGKLSPAKKQRLDALGFTWNTKDIAKHD